MEGSEQFLAERFEANRPHLRSVAYRMLGSLADAEDAVQEGWLHMQRSNTTAIDNLAAWLTTVVGRVCLDMLRARKSRDEHPQDTYVPDPIVTPAIDSDPEENAVMADSIGLAMMVVLDTLSPNERLCFVLHDVFAVPFDEIAPIVGRTPAAARQLASRARRQVQGAPRTASTSPKRQRAIVSAFLNAAQDGDFDQLINVLDPGVVLRADFGASPASRTAEGADAVAGGAILFGQLNGHGTRFDPVTVDGDSGMLVYRDGELVTVIGFGIEAERIVAISILADPTRLAALAIP